MNSSKMTTATNISCRCIITDRHKNNKFIINNDTDHDEGPIRKKAKTSSSSSSLLSKITAADADGNNVNIILHMISSLTDIGISKYNLDLYEEAEYQFACALHHASRVDDDLVMVQHPSSLGSGSSKSSFVEEEPPTTAHQQHYPFNVDGCSWEVQKATNKTASHLRLQTEEGHHPLMNHPIFGSMSVSSYDPAIPRTVQQQEVEFDEGMVIYDKPLQITHGSNGGGSRSKTPSSSTPTTSRLLLMEEIRSTIMYNIAQTYARRGDYEVAKEWFETSLSKWRYSSSFSSDRNNNDTTQQQGMRRTVMILHNIALCYYRLGQLKTAMIRYEDARTVVLRLIETTEDDISVSSETCTRKKDNTEALAATLNCLGVVQYHSSSIRQDRHATLVHFHHSLVLYKSMLSEDQVTTVPNNKITRHISTIWNNIGRVHFTCHEYEDAITGYESALSLREQVLGDTSSIHVGRALYNIGQCHAELGEVDEAMDCYQEFITIIRENNYWSAATTTSATTASSTPYSVDMALVYRDIAELFSCQSDMSHALHFFHLSLTTLCESHLGTYHPEVAYTLRQIGHLYNYTIQDSSTARIWYEQSRQVEQHILLDSLLVPLDGLAQSYKRCGQYEESITTYRKIQMLQTFAIGHCSLPVAATLSNIGLMHFELHQLDFAYAAYKEALGIRCSIYVAEDHKDIAFTLNALGLVLFHQEKFDLSHRCFQECLQIRESLLGSNHFEVGISWYNIASVNLAMGDDDGAIRSFTKTLQILRDTQGENHPDIILVLQYLGRCCHREGRTEEALEYYWEVLTRTTMMMQRKRTIPRVGGGENQHDHVVVDDEDEDDTGRTISFIGSILVVIGNLYLQQGNLEEMMHCFVRASRIFIQQQDDDDESSLITGRSLVVVADGYELNRLSQAHRPCAAMA